MRKGGGKQKGSAFERTICKELSLWISNGEQKDIFWRSAMSGGRSTVAMKKGDKLSAQAGDISSIHKLGHIFIDIFMVECKSYKTLNFESLVKGTGKLLEFWSKAKDEAARHDKLPILIGKQNNYPIVVCLDAEGVRRLALSSRARLWVCGHNLYIVLWTDFLTRNSRVLTRKERVKL